jgi:hypothetical protein
MGWWAGDNPGDVIGDGPADIMAAALQRLRGRPEGRPRLQELLAGLVSAMSRNPEALVQGADQLVQSHIIAEFADGTSVAVPASGRAPNMATDVLFDALDDIAVEYRDSELERAPRLGEILETLSFVLAPTLQNYVADQAGKKLSRIVATNDD